MFVSLFTLFQSFSSFWLYLSSYSSAALPVVAPLFLWLYVCKPFYSFSEFFIFLALFLSLPELLPVKKPVLVQFKFSKTAGYILDRGGEFDCILFFKI